MNLSPRDPNKASKSADNIVDSKEALGVTSDHQSEMKENKNKLDIQSLQTSQGCWEIWDLLACCVSTGLKLDELSLSYPSTRLVVQHKRNVGRCQLQIEQRFVILHRMM